MVDPLSAVSPLDGRYADRTAPLREWVSEGALMRARTQVEVEYLIALADLDATPLTISGATREQLRGIYETFDRADAALIKEIERTGAAGYPATNHDVKAVEYFLRERLPPDLDVDQWIHFGLTSEDVNNLAYRLLIRGAVTEVLRPSIDGIRGKLASLADEHRALPMLARTHGQPATPTTFGKELAVYASRLGRGLDRLDRAVADLSGKLAGASGTYAAHRVAYPTVDWPAFAAAFVTDLGLTHEPITSQVNPCDDLGVLFDALVGINTILLDLDLDAWLYISDRYLGQATTGGETGSSTMPHKVNPIDFENSEGNLSKATNDLRFLAESIRTSRLQRDLSDSTVKRNIGVAFAHCLIGYSKTADGLGTVVPNGTVMGEELRNTPAVLTEAIQTILRREGDPDAYERLKALSRGEEITQATVDEFIDALDVTEEVRAELQELRPETYTGFAAELVDELATRSPESDAT